MSGDQFLAGIGFDRRAQVIEQVGQLRVVYVREGWHAAFAVPDGVSQLVDAEAPVDFD